MPTYEYACRVCNHTFEKEQSIKDPPLKECPKCLVCALKRVINSEGGFILKGDGWENDGYASSDKKKADST